LIQAACELCNGRARGRLRGWWREFQDARRLSSCLDPPTEEFFRIPDGIPFSVQVYCRTTFPHDSVAISHHIAAADIMWTAV